MSLTTPTTKEISDNIIAQLEASLSQTVPLLPKAFLRVLARALAGVFVLLYKYGGFMFLQMFVRTATISDTTVNGRIVSPLKEWGRLIGVGDPAAATNAELLIDITVENQTGFLPSNTQLLNSDNGVTYITIGSVALTAATVQATIRAVSDQSGGGGRGAIGNLDAGATVSFANPLANVSRNASVVSQVVTASDGETTDAYRQRVIDRFQKRPQGGAYSDYELWGEEPAGIINVYPYTGSPGEVDVYVEATVSSSGSDDGIPTTAQLQEVYEAIQLDSSGIASRRPANAFVNVYSITRTAFDVEVVGLTVDDEAQTQADITAAVEDYFRSASPYIAGLSVPPRLDIISRAAVGGIVSDVVSAAGGYFSSVIVRDSGGTAVELYALGEGEKAKASTVTFL